MKAIAQQESKAGKWQIAVGVLLALWLSGCSQPVVNNSSSQHSSNQRVQNPNTEDKKVVLTTFTVLADMVRNVAGDKVKVESLTKIGAEIHGYEPTPSDLVRAQQADLIMDNGFGLERWAEKFYNNLKDVPHVTLSKGIDPILISEDAYAGKPNPHAWMSPQNALVYVENIRQALVELDPKHAPTYNANAKVYSSKIQNLDQKLRQEISALPLNQRYMVTCEGAFSYLTQDYDLKEVYIWAVNSERQATPKQVEKVINTVKTNQVPVIFCESTVGDKAQKEVAKASGAKFGGVFYVDSLSQPDGPVPSYLDLMEYNTKTLIKGFK
ncbi:MAG: metal ABC transporter substrate-binding protein [Symploca sp. SIO3C6]|nr:metal ABC transporter substrate-binding protein [Symploca sp. SIO3C6]